MVAEVVEVVEEEVTTPSGTKCSISHVFFLVPFLSLSRE
jgi:hypothetical protein